jgi:membrane protease YdiL (CAAX protease family)
MRSVFRGSDGSLHDGWRALLFALGAAAASSLAGSLRLAVPWPDALEAWLPAAGFTFLGILALTWIALQLERRPLASVGLELDRRWGREFLAGAAAGAAIILVIAWVVHLASGCHWVRDPRAGPGRLAAGAWLYLAVAASEELLYRGYPFQRLVRGLGSGPALGLTALLFTASHWGNPGMAGATLVLASLNIALAAVLLGLCRLRTGSLALPIGLHLGWNWTQGTLLGFGVSGLPGAGWWAPVTHGAAPWVTGGTFGLEASLPCTAVTAAACVALVRMRDRTAAGKKEKERD